MRTPVTYAVIRYLARFGAEFSPRDLEAWVPANSAARCCKHLARQGILTCLRRGTAGVYGLPPVYRRVV